MKIIIPIMNQSQEQDTIVKVLSHHEFGGLIYFKSENITPQGQFKINYAMMAKIIKAPNGFIALRQYLNDGITIETRRYFLGLAPAMKIFFI